MRVKLEDVCNNQSSNIIQRDIENLVGEYPIFGASGFIKNIDTYKQEQEYLAIVKDGAGVGRVMLLPPKSSVIGTLQYLIPKDNIIPNYLFYVISNMNLSKYANGATIPHIYFKDYKKEEFELPSFDQQQKIISILDQVNHIISLRTQQLEQLDLLIKSRFVEMFGDPKINNKNWETGTIGDYFNIKGGKRIPKGMGYSPTPTSHPYLRATDMKNETIIEDDIHYISDEVYKHIKNYTVNSGDIYLTNVGVHLGMAGIIPPKFDGANLTENAVKLVAKTEEKLNKLFLAYYINTPGIQEYINERKMAVGVPKLAIFRIETMPIILPPLYLQKQFMSFVEEVNKTKATVKQSLSWLNTLKSKLMQDYFG